MRKKLLLIVWSIFLLSVSLNMTASDKTRVIVTSDGEIDDQCSLVRFLLYSNDFDVEGIIKTSSQYHAQDHNWAGDYWEQPIYEAYEQLYPNLIKHDPDYPTPEYLRSITKLGNVKTEGEMSEVTEGSQLIVNVLLDETDNRPIWLQAWGGPNTIARALKTIEETHPEKMAYVAGKIRFYFIWEQDNTFQSYIRSNWATPYNIQTIISDQFITFGYWWQRWDMPEEPDSYFRSPWMKENIFKDMNNNPLIAYYNEKTKEKLGGNEDFIGEGDSPSFIHEIPTGLRNLESPEWGGWGGRYVLIRENTWLDKVPIDGYNYPSGRWYTSTGWGRQNYASADQELLEEYFKPITRWIDVIQNDFAARVDWCVKSYSEANHEPMVSLSHPLDIVAQPGYNVQLSALGTSDPDGDQLNYSWWQYTEADSYNGTISIQDAGNQNASFIVPTDADIGQTIHIICEVTDNGTPPLTRYQRVIVTVGSCTSEPVTGVNVTPVTKDIGVGDIIQLIATVEPECAGNKNVSWSSSNSSIASVSSSGLVTGIAEGSAIITATTQDGGFTATCNVSVTDIPIPTYDLTTSVNGQGSVSPSSGNFNEGSVVTLNATPDAGWQFDNWSGDASGSSNPVSITMDGNKLVTANFSVIPNTTSITIQENETGFCSVDGSVDNNNSGFTGTGFANTDNSNGNGITWSVNIPTAGSYNIVFKYANGGSTDRTAQLMEDGSTIVSNISMPSTGSWTSWTETPAINVSLSAGTKLIRLQATNSSGLANMDYITISGGSISAVACAGLKSAAMTTEIAEADMDIKYYPVPVDNLLNIEFGKELTGSVDIYLFDNTGKALRFDKANGSNYILDMSGLPNGLYTVRILGANLNTLEHVVKK